MQLKTISRRELRNVFMIAILLCCYGNTDAQTKCLKDGSVGFNYHSYRYGRGINLTYRQELPWHFSIIGGIKYHINDVTTYGTRFPDPTDPNEPEAFILRFYAGNLGQRLGVKFGIERSFALNLRHTELFGYYDFQFTELNLQIIDYVSSNKVDSLPGSVTIKYSEKTYLDLHSYSCFEHHLGIGARFAVSEKCAIKLQVGVGFLNSHEHMGVTVAGSGSGLAQYMGESEWLFSRMYGVGIEYKIKRGRSIGRS